MKKIEYYLQILLVLICFFLALSVITNDLLKLILILFLSPFALYFSHVHKFFVIFFALIAAVAGFIFLRQDNMYIIVFFVFASTIPIPYYFLKQSFNHYEKLKKRNNELKFFREELFNEQKSQSVKRKQLERNLESIMQLYVIARDLVKNISIDESANALIRVLAIRHGVRSVGVFARTKKANMLPFAFSKIEEKEKWLKYIQENGSVEEIKECCIFETISIFDGNPVVAWPVRIDRQLLVCVFLVVEKEFAQTYVEEGLMFIPHLMLGTKRIKLFAEVNERSRIDGLTGLYLRRYFMERLHTEVQRAKRYKTDFYIMMADIDFFKKVNDTYGHQAGDEVLASVAKMFNKYVRPGDLVGRYGGEEFIVFLPMLSQDDVVKIATQIKLAVEKTKVTFNNRQISVTVSIGISKYPVNGLKSDNLISAADKALYKAKQDGRNRIVIYFSDKQ